MYDKVLLLILTELSYMPQVCDPESLGKKLRKARNEANLPLVAVVGFLKDDHNLSCSISNLAKIERGDFQAKSNIIAALCLIYDLDPRKLLFRNYRI